MRCNLKGIIFDLDGTLTLVRFRTGDSLHRQYVQKLKEGLILMFQIPEEIVRDLRLLSEIREVTVSYLERKNATMNEIKSVLSFIDSVIDEFSHKELTSSKLDPDAIYVLSRLKHKGLKIGLFTFSSRKVALRTLRKYNIEEYFDAIVTRTDVIHAKPNPLHLLATINSLNLEPKDVGVVSDSLMDIKSGREIGVRFTMLILRKSTIPYPTVYSPDFRVKKLRDILNIIDFNE